MKLRNKVLISITIVWVVFTAIIYLGSSYFLLTSFLNLETDRANRDLARVNEALDQVLYSLSTYTADWSNWDDAYEYIKGNNPQFAPNNIKLAALGISTINLLTYWDKDGKLLIGSMADTEKNKFIPFSKGLEHDITLLKQAGMKNEMKGYIAIPNGIMMVASSGVTNGDHTKPVLGVLVTGRIITKTILDKIRDTTKLDLSLLLPEQIKKNKSINAIYKTISSNQTGTLQETPNGDTLYGYTIIRDIANKPIGMMTMTVPRAIYHTGENALHYFLTCIIALGILLAILMSYILRAMIVKRLEHLNNDIEEITKQDKFVGRVDTQGNDELTSVSLKVNQMIDAIQISHEHLEQRVEERTNDLKREISERKIIEKELITHKEYLSKIAHYDMLTSLPNRIYFNEILNAAITAAKDLGQELALFFIDLDRFKKINDALGHHIGDKVLKEVADSISAVLNKGDVLARLGGDEFIVLLNNIQSKRSVTECAERILRTCREPIKINSYDLHITTSIGITLFPTDGACLEDLQKNADIAMYKSKHSGGNNFQYFTQDMNAKVTENIQMESALINAIKNNEFILYYQPKINIKSGKMMGVEALIRWNHPELGVISPSKFIPLTEELGLILQIGEWVLETACKANQTWQANGLPPISVAVNLSPKQFKLQDIDQLVKRVLDKTQLDPVFLELEITESAVMDNMEMTTNKINYLKQLGIKIAIDDFGTGCTSINYLKEFPVSVLKIDQSFIKGLPSNHHDASIIEAMIILAHTFDMQVVAEGVETAEQFTWLAGHACDIVQGYFLSRPLPEEKLIAELESMKIDKSYQLQAEKAEEVE